MWVPAVPDSMLTEWHHRQRPPDGQGAVTPGLTIFLEVRADGTGGGHKSKPFTEEFKVARGNKNKKQGSGCQNSRERVTQAAGEV